MDDCPFPPELWLHIAQFIPSSELPRYMGVNRIFFELALDERYREVEMMDPNPQVILKVIDLLSLPSASRRVRVLNVWPASLWESLKREHIALPHVNEVKKPTILKRLKERTLRGWRRPPVRPVHHLPIIYSPSERQHMLLTALSQCINVNDLSLNFSGWKTPQEDPSMTGLLKTTWTNLGPRLRTLQIVLPLQSTDALFPSPETLSNLRHFTLRLYPPTQNLSSASSNEATIFAEELAPFISSLSPNLESLKLITSKHIDFLPVLFHHLGANISPSSQLKSLHLEIPIDHQHFLTPSSLHLFLKSLCTPSLTKLTLKYVECCVIAQDNRDEWVEALFRDIVFENVNVLEVAPDMKGGCPTALFAELARSCPGVTSLTVLGCLTLFRVRKTIFPFCRSRVNATASPSTAGTSSSNDGKQVIGPSHISSNYVSGGAGGGLKHIKLCVKKLSPQLVDFLATNCKTLESLYLDVDVVVATDMFGRVNEEKEFIKVMRGKRHPTWHLSDIAIYHWVYSVGRRHHLTCMEALADIFPSIQFFEGVKKGVISPPDSQPSETSSEVEDI